MDKHIRKTVKKAIKHTNTCKTLKRSLHDNKYDLALSGKDNLCYLCGSILCKDGYVIVSVDLPVVADKADDECAARLTEFANHANNAVFASDVTPMLAGRFSFVGYENLSLLGAVRYCEWISCVDGRRPSAKAIGATIDRVRGVACEYYDVILEVALGKESAWDAIANHLGPVYRLSNFDMPDWVVPSPTDTYNVSHMSAKADDVDGLDAGLGEGQTSGILEDDRMMVGSHVRTLERTGAEGHSARVDVSNFFDDGAKVAVVGSLPYEAHLVLIPSELLAEEIERVEESLAQLEEHLAQTEESPTREADEEEAYSTRQWLTVLHTARIARVEGSMLTLSSEQVNGLELGTEDTVILIGVFDHIEIWGLQNWERMSAIFIDLIDPMSEDFC